MKLGSNILTIRKKKNLSAEKLGEMIGVSKQAVYQYEQGKSFPGQEVLAKLADVLGVSVSDLYAEEGNLIEHETVPGEVYRDLIERNSHYILVSKFVLNDEYRIMLKSEIDLKDRFINKIIDLAEKNIAAKDSLIDQLKKEIESLRTAHSKEA